MGEEKKVLTPEERVALNRRIAESYIGAYDKTRVKEGNAVKDGAIWEAWVFSKDADYWSPYFGNGTINLATNPISVEDSATFEALSYSIEFADWAPLDFECFPCVEGCAWKSHFGGHRRDNGEFMDFFAYSYIHTNEYGEITHWETHVNSDFSDFLQVAIGDHGPYKNGADVYMAAVVKKLASAGIDIRKIKH